MPRTDILERKEEILKWIEEFQSKAYICRQLNCKPETLNSYLNKMGISYQGNQGLKGVASNQYKTAEEYAKGNNVSSHKLKEKMIKDGLKKHQCELCLLEEWQGRAIPLELHHKDGNNTNNDLSNLCFLCPNCHSQTENYCGKNNSGKTKISDEEILEAYNKTNNIHQTLLCVGLSPMGGNYSRVKRIIKTYQSINKK